MKRQPMTLRERECRNFIAGYRRRRGVSPCQFEIAGYFNAESRGFVCRVLKSLQTKGYIRIRMYEPRGIELT